jgi:hypothetical protein
VDKVEFTPWTLVSLGEAVDNTGLTWSTDPGNANWFGQTTVSYYGGDAAQSGSITHGQATSLETSSQSNMAGHDYLRFYIDGEQKDLIAGSVDWEQKSYSINSGSHTLEWRYAKDSAGSEGSDCGWVDNVEFTP